MFKFYNDYEYFKVILYFNVKFLEKVNISVD